MKQYLNFSFLPILMFACFSLVAKATDLAETEEDIEINGTVIPKDAVYTICEALDPRSLHRTMRVSRPWYQQINSEPRRLFLPLDGPQRLSLFAQNNFPALFRRACNTKGGIGWLSEYSGFFPSQFLAAFHALPEDDQPFYLRLFQTEIPQELNQADLVKAFDRLPAIFIEGGNITLNIDPILSRLKLLRITNPALFHSLVSERLPEALLRFEHPLGSSFIAEEAKKCWSAYVVLLQETPESLSALNQITGSYMSPHYKAWLTPAINFLVRKVQVSPSLKDDERFMIYEGIFNKFLDQEMDHMEDFLGSKPQYPSAQALRTTIYNILVSMHASPLPLAVKLDVAAFLEDKFKHPCGFPPLAVTAAQEGIFTRGSLQNLLGRARPEAFEGVVQRMKEIEAEKKEIYALDVAKSLMKSQNPYHRRLLVNFVTRAFKLDGTEKQKKKAACFLDHTCFPIKVLMQHRPDQVKPLLMRAAQSYAYLENETLYIARHFVTLLNDRESAQTIWDCLFAKKEKLSMKDVLSLALAYLFLKDQVKAQQCLDLVMENPWDDENEPSNIIDAMGYWRNLKKIALVNARMGYTERAIHFFRYASQKALRRFEPFKPDYKRTPRHVYPSKIILSILADAETIGDLHFLRDIYQPYFKRISEERNDLHVRDILMCSFVSHKLGLEDLSQVFFGKFVAKRDLLPVEGEREELEALLKVNSGECLSLSKEDLFTKMASKMQKRLTRLY